MRRWPDDERREPLGPARHRAESDPENFSSRLSRWLDWFLTFLAFVWTAVVVAELTFGVSESGRDWLANADLAIWLMYAFAFFLQFALAPEKLRYLRTHALTAVAVVLPVVRIVQVVGAIRLLRPAWLAQLILHGNRAIRETGELFQQQRLYYVIVLLGITTLLGAAGVFFFERDVPGSDFHDFGETLWWAAALATTINTSADPTTVEGRVIGWLLRVVALAFFGYVTGSIASFLTAERMVPPTSTTGEEQTLDQLAKHVADLRVLLDRLEAELRARDTADRRD